MQNQDGKDNTPNNFQGARQNSPMEMARQNGMQGERGFNRNPYIADNSFSVNDNISSTQNPYYNQTPNQQANSTESKSTTNSLLGAFDTENFIKGALIGAVGAYLLTNETAQKAIFKGVAKTTSMFQTGMEEMKERFEDAQAELDAERES